MRIEANCPWTSSISKNAIWKRRRNGGVYLTEEARAFSDGLILVLRTESHRLGLRWEKRKTWLTIRVRLPNHRADALNVLDLLADSVKIGIDLDDRWFAVRLLDWEIDAKNPGIFIAVEQDDPA